MELDASRVASLHCGGNGWNWMITGHKAGHTKYLDYHNLIGQRVPFRHLLHCGGNGWNWMLNVCLSGISSIVAVMDA